MATKTKKKAAKKPVGVVRKIATTVYLDTKQIAKLRKKAKATGLSQAEIVRQGVDHELAKAVAA